MSAYHKYNVTKLNKVVSRDLNDYINTNDYYYSIQVAQPLNDPVESYNRARDLMPGGSKDHPEAYYLYFIAITGMLLNLVVVMAIFIKKPMRKMTSGFLIHACFLDFTKSAYCIPIARNLLSQARPADCDFFGASFVILITISVFNMVAMVCTEAYTFGEKNIGGNSKGTVICITFGIVLVYIGSVILHLGPTLIGGHFEFQPDLGSCSFPYGKQTGYVAYVMWTVITSVAMIAVFHFIHRLYKEIQINRPNRVSFLVRTSITVLDTASSSTCRLRKIIRDSTHRAKMFILNCAVFILCWYPFFFLCIIDKNFQISLNIYEAFAFIAWSHGAIQPILYILFDRNIALLSKYVYCDKYDIDNILQNMIHRQRHCDQTDVKQRSSSADSENNSITAMGITENRLLDIINEHHDMCIVQNTSNQDMHNRVIHADILSSDMDLSSDMSPCANIPPEYPTPPLRTDSASMFISVENPTYNLNRIDTSSSTGFTPVVTDTVSRNSSNRTVNSVNQQIVIPNEDLTDVDTDSESSVFVTEVQF